jgi:hypothetical protein
MIKMAKKSRGALRDEVKQQYVAKLVEFLTESGEDVGLTKANEFNFPVVDSEGNALDFDGEGDYKWFADNCHKYGFVVRCPEGKEDVTGQGYRPWHFRYVGKVHATYMNENGLCLEEYVKKIKTYPYEGKHLETKDADGKKYEIYYFESDLETAMTSVAIPTGYEYEISGDNNDGFIVTVCLDKPIEPESDESSKKDESSKPEE